MRLERTSGDPLGQLHPVTQDHIQLGPEHVQRWTLQSPWGKSVSAFNHPHFFHFSHKLISWMLCLLKSAFAIISSREYRLHLKKDYLSDLEDTFEVEEHHKRQSCTWEWFEFYGQMSLVTELHYFMFTFNILTKGCQVTLNFHSRIIKRNNHRILFQKETHIYTCILCNCACRLFHKAHKITVIDQKMHIKIQLDKNSSARHLRKAVREWIILYSLETSKWCAANKAQANWMIRTKISSNCSIPERHPSCSLNEAGKNSVKQCN